MPTSQKRIDANRRNAARSTGPRTERGRRISSLNALKHGMASRQDVVPGEDARELDQRLDSWLATLLPKNPVERSLIEVAVKATWRVDRVMRVQADAGA